MKNRLKTGSYTCRSLWTAGRRDSTVFGVVDDTTTTKFVNRACAVHSISLPVVVDKVVVVVLKFPNDRSLQSRRITCQRLSNDGFMLCMVTNPALRHRENFVFCSVNIVLCLDNIVLCFTNTVLCFDKPILCLEVCSRNILLCFKNYLLCLQCVLHVKHLLLSWTTPMP